MLTALLHNLYGNITKWNIDFGSIDQEQTQDPCATNIINNIKNILFVKRKMFLKMKLIQLYSIHNSYSFMWDLITHTM